MGTGTPVFDAVANVMLIQINLSKEINNNFDKAFQNKIKVLDELEKSAKFINDMKTLKEIVSVLNTLACALDKLNQLRLELSNRNLMLNNCVYKINDKSIEKNNSIEQIIADIEKINEKQSENNSKFENILQDLPPIPSEIKVVKNVNFNDITKKVLLYIYPVTTILSGIALYIIFSGVLKYTEKYEKMKKRDEWNYKYWEIMSKECPKSSNMAIKKLGDYPGN